MNSLFCRHNRFTADCPICSKGTLLDESRPRAVGSRSTTSARPAARGRSRAQEAAGARTVAGPYVSVGPYERDDDAPYEVRFERVPGGIRLAQWSQGALERRAPVLAGGDVGALVAAAQERELLAPADLQRLESALTAPAREEDSDGYGASPGRSGLMRDELRVERADDDRVRVARWIYRPNEGWEIQDAPTMLPAARYAEALEQAVTRGVI